MKNRFLTVLLSVLIISLSSCGEEEDPTPQVTMSIKHVGYSYVDFNIQLMDVWVGTNFPEAIFYYDTINDLTDDSPSQSKGFEGDDFTLTLVGLEMDQDYYVKVVAEGISSPVRHLVTNKIDIVNCAIDEGYILGDNSISRQWVSDPSWSGPRYLDHESSNHLRSYLQGDFKQIDFIIPVSGHFYEGVYTTYNEKLENGISPSQGTSTIRLTDNDGVTYDADADQVFEYSVSYSGSYFYLTFCDLTFVSEVGQTITLSANMEGR